jgi:beta-N-acetylhexosaminidase
MVQYTDIYSKKSPKNLPLVDKIRSMIMIGFHDDKIDAGAVGGVVLYKYNIKSPIELKQLTENLLKINPELLIAVDQEGGLVQRLSEKAGFISTASAQYIADHSTPEEAGEIYNRMARELHDYHINVNFAPVVDLNNPDSLCPVIGKLERSFGDNVAKVTSYAEKFIDAHHANAVLTAVKHFPGHGYALKDSHLGMTDVTGQAKDIELEPYYELMKHDKIDMVMTAHVINKKLDEHHPATLSPLILKTLLRDHGYQGVIVSDDLFMGAIIQHYGFEESIVLAVNAGCDLLIFSDNIAAYKDAAPNFKPVDNIPHKVVEVITDAIVKGLINPQSIDDSYARIEELKYKLSLLENPDIAFSGVTDIHQDL